MDKKLNIFDFKKKIFIHQYVNYNYFQLKKFKIDIPFYDLNKKYIHYDSKLHSQR